MKLILTELDNETWTDLNKFSEIFIYVFYNEQWDSSWECIYFYYHFSNNHKSETNNEKEIFHGILWNWNWIFNFLGSFHYLHRFREILFSWKDWEFVRIRGTKFQIYYQHILKKHCQIDAFVPKILLKMNKLFWKTGVSSIVV